MSQSAAFITLDCKIKTMVAPFLSGGWRPGEPFPERERDILSLDISRYRGRTRATIKVQDGCNFPFSFREGTIAAKLWRDAPIDPIEIRRRARVLAELDGDWAEDVA
jgi:tRNA A37 methylthiotransferase MiaB